MQTETKTLNVRQSTLLAGVAKLNYLTVNGTSKGESLPAIHIQHRWSSNREAFDMDLPQVSDRSNGKHKGVIAGSKTLRATSANEQDAVTVAHTESQRLERGIAPFELIQALG